MRISVNLATRPFVELRPFFMRLRIAMVVLVLVGIGIAVATHSMEKKLASAQARMNRLKAETAAMRSEKQDNEQRMRQPANAQVLARARFLNTLFLKKSFSWTAVMMDLENVLPLGVQVTSIEPQIGHGGDVIIHLRVSGDRDRAVDLVRNLEQSKRFLDPHINSESSQTKQNANGAQPQPGGPWAVEFEILANYNPLPENMSYTQVKSDNGDAKQPVVARENTKAHRALPHDAMPRAGRHVRRNGVVLKPFVARKPGGAQ